MFLLLETTCASSNPSVTSQLQQLWPKWTYLVNDIPFPHQLFNLFIASVCV